MMNRPMKAVDAIAEEIDTQDLYMSDFEDGVGTVLEMLERSSGVAKADVKILIAAITDSIKKTANPEVDIRDTLMQVSEILRDCAINASASQ